MTKLSSEYTKEEKTLLKKLLRKYHSGQYVYVTKNDDKGKWKEQIKGEYLMLLKLTPDKKMETYDYLGLKYGRTSRTIQRIIKKI